ncbi:hypothetical protein RFI_40098 [Reticulomyxa filosa]|uniref:Uncharacterized protein n=1 Tax=Reticulomyxa filosa TaxID=46433 RepID=X6L8P2_RETFI|nr:hypothetical protein RFI_40098 [Reticulomyxa filosa]|eukprot:ETN97431.1 hypothetical protein RFI_40098 [Reticulomyxa filosa]
MTHKKYVGKFRCRETRASGIIYLFAFGKQSHWLLLDFVFDKIQIKIGDDMKLSRGKEEVVKYIGETDLMKEDFTDLEKKHFEANVCRGHFTREAQVMIPLVKPLGLETSNATFQLKPLEPNSRIVFVSGEAISIIKYIGYPPFAEIEVICIELDLFF